MDDFAETAAQLMVLRHHLAFLFATIIGAGKGDAAAAAQIDRMADDSARSLEALVGVHEGARHLVLHQDDLFWAEVRAHLGSGDRDSH